MRGVRVGAPPVGDDGPPRHSSRTPLHDTGKPPGALATASGPRTDNPAAPTRPSQKRSVADANRDLLGAV